MDKQMTAAVMTGLNKIELVQRPIPAPSGTEVLVKILHVGICGSDMHFFEHGRIGDYIVKPPFVLGHESAGVVVEVGTDVKNIKVGDKVALEPGLPCGDCEFCRRGEYNLCPDVRFMAAPPVDGVFAEYMAYPAKWCYKLPEGLDTIEGAMVEPLSVGLHSAMQAGAHVGQTAAILGAGCIGLCTLLALKKMGVDEIYISDVIAKRLEKAAELGAFKVINAAETDTVKAINQATNGRGVDLVFETAGNPRTTAQTVELVRRGGVICMVGMSGEDLISMPMNTFIFKEATMKSVFRYRNLYPVAIEAIKGGLPIKSVVSHYRKFDKIEDAMNYNAKNPQEVIKTVIEL